MGFGFSGFSLENEPRFWYQFSIEQAFTYCVKKHVVWLKFHAEQQLSLLRTLNSVREYSIASCVRNRGIHRDKHKEIGAVQAKARFRSTDT
jgi:hypothetical protein